MRLDVIQALRGFAAYLVLIYHMRSVEETTSKDAGYNDPPVIDGIFENGYAGVDLFFVISGFIMVFVTARRPETLSTIKDFALARIFRIYPPWWLFATIMAIYMIMTHGVPVRPDLLAASEESSFSYLLKSYLLLPQENFPVLAVGWTLIHEMYFYFAFALILLAPRSLMPVWLVLWGLIVLGGALLGWSGRSAIDFPHLIFSPMTLEFIAGGLAAWLFVKGHNYFPAVCLGAGLIAMLACLQLHPYPTPFTLEWGRVLVFTLPCVLMVYGAAGVSGRVSGMTSKIWSALGDWSFAMYLSHILVIKTLERAMPVAANVLEHKLGAPDAIVSAFRLGQPGIADNIVFIALALICATVFAGLIYHFFEQPALRFLNRFRGRRESDKGKTRLIETTAP